MYRISTASAQELTIQPTVIPQVNNQLKIQQLETTYFGQLEQYRNQEQLYIVAKNQYLQLNTLASQELAVKEARTLLSLRADVLTTFLEILKEKLAAAKGVPLENKNPELITISLLLEQVKLHKQRVEAAQDRFAIDQESQNFSGTVMELESHTYYILSLIKVGTVQEAYDKLIVVKNAVRAYVDQQPLTNTQKSEKERGFAEIDRTIQTLDTSFTPVRNELYGSPGSGDLSTYSNLSKRLNPAYANLNQIIQFLEEIKK